MLQATEDARVQAAIDAANDPATNGGSTAPEGCPFPIINGRCANGVLSKQAGDTMFGSKSIAEASNDPQHAVKGAP